MGFTKIVSVISFDRKSSVIDLELSEFMRSSKSKTSIPDPNIVPTGLLSQIETIEVSTTAAFRIELILGTFPKITIN